MIYENIVPAKFIDRPNRFIAHCEIESGKIETVHVKNTGRCKELLIPGCKVYLQDCNSPTRKTRYDLISVEKVIETESVNENQKHIKLINMDSKAANKVIAEWVKEAHFVSDITLIKPECTFGNSRFDFYIETGKEKIFVEVKGVTLENNGQIRFPDAPTARGVKHLQELIEAKKQGFRACVFFVIQMKDVKVFSPNYETHKEFAETLKLAAKNGVEVFAYDCLVTENSLSINKPVEIRLEG